MKHSCQDTGWVLIAHTDEEDIVFMFLVHSKEHLRREITS